MSTRGESQWHPEQPPDGLSRLSWIDVKRWEARSVYALRYGVDTLTANLCIRRLQHP